jgi:hypothetical protein
MSFVSSVILVCELDDPCIHPIQDWLRVENKPPLARVNELCGGNKAMQCDVWGGAFNYLDDREFILFVKSLPWEGAATLVINPEHSYEDGNHIVVLGKGEDDDE